MVRIALTQAQSESIAKSDQPVEVIDAQGRLVGVLNCIRPDTECRLSVTADAIDQLSDRVQEPVKNLLSTSDAIERIRGQLRP
jgi:uncharacterized radical SAM superfamily protein